MKGSDEMRDHVDAEILEEIGRVMDEQDIPIRGRKLLSKDGIMIMDDRPPVFRSFSKRSGSPRISKHRKARKQRHK